MVVKMTRRLKMEIVSWAILALIVMPYAVYVAVDYFQSHPVLTRIERQQEEIDYLQRQLEEVAAEIEKK